MNCKYCGAALPTKGIACPNCGKVIPVSQQKQMHDILDPKWNEYRNQNTALYKSESNNSDTKIGKIFIIIILIIIGIIIIAIIKGMG